MDSVTKDNGDSIQELDAQVSQLSVKNDDGDVIATPAPATVHPEDSTLDKSNESATNVWNDDQEAFTGHPLEITVESLESSDHWEQQGNTEVANPDNNQEVSLSNGAISVLPPSAAVPDAEFPVDTSHTKGFYNATDSDEILDLNVQGQLPSWLVGEHFTVGPGTYDVKYMRKMEIDGNLENVTATFTFGHWFDSLPLVNRFDLHGQRNSISYRRRLTCFNLIEKIRDNHGYTPLHPAGLFKTDTNQTMFAKFLMSGSKTPKADTEPCAARILTGIPGVDGRLLCQNYANHIQELDPFDLKPTRILSWNEINPAFKGSSSCANGKFDQQTGEYINFTMDVGYSSTQYNFFSISDREPKGHLIASVSGPTAFVNSFSVTPKYIILVIFPILAKAGGMKFTWSASVLDSFSFHPTEPTLFYVISREKRQHVATYASSAAFSFNHVNAFEDDQDNVYVDIVCYPDDTIAHQLTTESLRQPSQMKPPRLSPSEVRRYSLTSISTAGTGPAKKIANGPTRLFGAWRKNQGSGRSVQNSYSEAQFEKWLQPSLELPQVNPDYSMKGYTYMYGVGFSAESSISDGKIWDSIVKANMKTRAVVAAWYEDHCYPSEALFVPRPSNGPKDEVAEDDGVLLSVVLDAARNTSFLLVLDARSLSVLAKADLCTLVPLSFAHGSYRLHTL